MNLFKDSDERINGRTILEELIKRFSGLTTSGTNEENGYSCGEFFNPIGKRPARKIPELILAETILKAEMSSAMHIQETLFGEIVKLDQLVKLLESELKDQSASKEKIIADLHDKMNEMGEENTQLRTMFADSLDKIQELRDCIEKQNEILTAVKETDTDKNDFENTETISNKAATALGALKNGDIDDPQVNKEIDNGLCQTDEIIDLTDEVTISEDGISTTAANAKK